MFHNYSDVSISLSSLIAGSTQSSVTACWRRRQANMLLVFTNTQIYKKLVYIVCFISSLWGIQTNKNGDIFARLIRDWLSWTIELRTIVGKRISLTRWMKQVDFQSFKTPTKFLPRCFPTYHTRLSYTKSFLWRIGKNVAWTFQFPVRNTVLAKGQIFSNFTPPFSIETPCSV